MTRFSLFAAAAAAAFALPLAAHAQDADPAMAAFQSICSNTGASYLDALKAADADGWANTAVVPEPDTAVSITDRAAREKALPGGGSLMLMVDRGLQHTKGGDVPVSSCKVSTTKPDNGVVPRAQAWVGFAPDSGDNTLSVYYVKPGSNKPEHIPASGLNAAMAAGGFSIIKVQQDPSEAIFVYTTYSK